MDYVICDAGQEHLPQLAAFDAVLLSAPWTRVQLASQLPDDQHVFLIAVAGRRCSAANFLRARYEGDIGNVAVAPEYRRQGHCGLLDPTLRAGGGAQSGIP